MTAAKYTNFHTGAASVLVFSKIHKFLALEQVFLYLAKYTNFRIGASVSVFTDQTVQDSFAFKGEREVDLHNRDRVSSKQTTKGSKFKQSDTTRT